MRQVITSSKNQRIKDAVALGKGRKRKAAGLFGAEGEREITRAIISGYVPESLFICLDLVTEVFSKFLAESERRHGFMVYEVSKEVFEKHLKDAGRFIGLGRFRPRNNGTYGRFDSKIISWKKED